MIAAIGGKPDFSDLSFTINKSKFLYGHFLNALLAFATIAAVIFFFVIKPVNSLLARFGPAAEEDSKDCAECKSKIPLSARRCAFCTSQVAA